MTGLILRKIKPALSDTGICRREGALTALLAAFIFGLVFGSLVGVFSDVGATVFDVSIWESGFADAWIFFLLLLLFSTTYLGVALIPVLMFVRGTVFSCSAAVLYKSLGVDGLVLGLIGSAVPMCFLLPVYLLVGSDCFGLSMRLARLQLGRGGYCGALFPPGHFFVMLAMIFFDALYSVYFAPVLLSALI